MKTKKYYLFTLVLIVFAFIFYWIYDWRENPFAEDRIVWDDPNPQLIGKRFLITGNFKYHNTSIYQRGSKIKPIEEVGLLILRIDEEFEQKEIEKNCPSLNCILLDRNSPLIIERTFWHRINSWGKMVKYDKKYAIIRDVNNKISVFDFDYFALTDHPQFKAIADQEHDLPWNRRNEELAY